jgi:hypothetical protein
VVSESLIVIEAGVSAGSRHNRPGLTRLLESEIGRWDVLLCYESSRLARNGQDMGWIRNQLSLWGKDAYEAVSGLSIQVRAAISQIESLLQASPEKAHLALEKLLRGNRITVHQSLGSRDYHIEGTAELALETHTARRAEATGRMLLVVAGEGFEPPTSGL